jgi:hypothetical protein
MTGPLTSACADTEGRFSDRYDDALHPSARDAFDAHLSACARCHDAFAAFTAPLSMLRALPAPSPPPSLHLQLDALAHAHSHPLPLARRWGAFDALAALVLAGVCGLWLAARLSHVTPLTLPNAPARAGAAALPSAAAQAPPRLRVALPPDIDRTTLLRRLREQGWSVAAADGDDGPLVVTLTPARLRAFERALRGSVGLPPLPPLPPHAASAVAVLVRLG